MAFIDATTQKVRRSAIAGYACLLVALTLVLLISAWGARREISDDRKASLNAELARLRSHADRTVGRIESYLENQPSEVGLDGLRGAIWLEDFWRHVVPRERQRLYAALVDEKGVVIMHSDPGQRGKRLEARWFERSIPETGGSAVQTRSTTLASGRLAYDIRVPVEVRGRELGAYHSGFDAAWLEDAVQQRARRVYARWFLIGGLIAAVVLGAGVSLFHLARRTGSLQQALIMTRTQKLAELGQLAGALAHEIRNPLNAMRLNLHTVSRYLHDRSAIPAREVSQIVRESELEIERLESLIRSILGYARPEQAQVQNVDLRFELEAVVSFVGQMMNQDNIVLRVQAPDAPVMVRMDRDRLRQMILNLLNNAHEAIGRTGEISVEVSHRDHWVDLNVTDSGHGVAPEDRDRIFEPFFTTKDKGCGLGLALVKRFAEEAGGTVVCESDGNRGARFRVCLPEVVESQ